MAIFPVSAVTPAFVDALNSNFAAVGTVARTIQSNLQDVVSGNAGRLNLSFGATGNIFAIGSNAAPTNFVRGLQIGGADPLEGTDGILDHLDGHSTWRGFWPSRNYASMELALNSTMAAFQGSVTIGGNTITRLQGSATDVFWVGKKCYFGEARYKTSAVSGNVVTVTNLDNSPVSWPATTTEIFKFCIVYGTGTCDVAGTAVTRRTGDPFVIYNTDPSFNLRINGSTVSASAMAPDTATLTASLGTLTSVAFEYWLDINDQFSTLRLHGSNSDTENLSLFSRYDGYWIASQFGSYGQFRPIFISTGEITAGVPRRQVTLYADGRVTLGGAVGRPALNIEPVGSSYVNYFGLSGAPTGVSPSLRARGADPNVGMGFDTQGTGSYTFTSAAFTKTEFQIFGNGGAAWLSIGSDPTNPFLAAAGATNGTVDVRGKGTGGVQLKDGGNAVKFGVNTTGIGFFATTPVAKQAVTGSRAANAALASLLTALAATGLLTDSSTA